MLQPSEEVDGYKIYSEDAFTTAVSEGKRVVLNFRASRCPTCTDVSNNILANISNLPANVVVLETDYDKYAALKTTYNVRQQTTFVFFDESGEYQKTIETIRSFDDLVNNL
jgi:thiol:disulfide interchange protein